MRRREPYTDTEVEAFDTGFKTAMAVARQSAVWNMFLFHSAKATSEFLKTLEKDMQAWLDAQHEQDKEDNCEHGEYFVFCQLCAPCAQHDVHACTTCREAV